MKFRKIVIIILSAVAIALMMPKRGMVSLQPVVGQKWTEQTIVASFDVPIQKAQETIDAQRSKVGEEAKPVFTIDRGALAAKLEALERYDKLDSLSLVVVEEALREFYLKGIVSFSEFSKYRNRAIYLSHFKSDTLSTVYVGGLYTPQSAVEILEERCDSLSTDFIESLIGVNVTYNDALSTAVRREAISDVSLTSGVVRRGETVVSSGQIVDNQTLMLIRSYNEEMARRLGSGASEYWVLFLRFCVIFCVLLLNYLFFSRFSVHYLGEDNRKLLFVLLLYLFMAALVGLVVSVGGSAYLVPLPIAAIYLLTFFNMRVAILGNLTNVLICSLFVTNPFDFFVINIFSGLVAIFTMRHYYHRGKLLRAIGAILLSEVVLYHAMVLLRDETLASVDYLNLVWIMVSALLFLGFYQFSYLLERAFGFVSDVTLLELCDTNQPLLMELAQNAPGTFQHSVQVANLAESAAKEIGANPLLARTGALYHDIGKMTTPFYFVENLTGVFNPHNDITTKESIAIIKSHVTEGLAIAKKYKLPTVVQHFIERHHGESLIYYFYDKAQRESDGAKVEESDFRYEGPRPVLREVSLCMMADAIEAASRSLPSYEAEVLDKLVDNIVGAQIRDGQFADSQLTFEEVGRVKALFKSKLNNIYHGRIAYPVRK